MKFYFVVTDQIEKNALFSVSDPYDNAEEASNAAEIEWRSLTDSEKSYTHIVATSDLEGYSDIVWDSLDEDI